jgi:hypothetical protein
MVQGLVDESAKGFHPFALVNSGVPAFIFPTSSTPNVTVQLNRDSVHGGCGAAYYQLPIPAGSKVENVYESHATLFAPNGNEYDFYEMTAPGVTPLPYPGQPDCPANSNWQTRQVHVHPWNGSGWSAGWGGAGAGEGAGVRYLDMRVAPGSTWNHALHIALDNTSNGSYWPRAVAPGSGGDGQCGGTWAPVSSTGCIPEGARIQLDPSIDCSTWPSLVNAAEWKRVMCRTLQKYGAIVSETGRGIETEWNKASDKGDCAPASCYSGLLGLNWSSNELPYDLYSHFRVIDWTKWTG